jgi:glutamate transport system permease protein
MIASPRTLADRLLSVPRPKAGELALTEELGPKGKRIIGGLSLASLIGVAYAIWWMYGRLGEPTRLYPKGQFEPTLWEPFKQWTTWKFLWEGAKMTLLAALVGTILAMTIGLLMSSLRHGARPKKWPLALAALVGSLGIVAALGSLVSARVASLAAVVCLIAGLVFFGQQTAAGYTEFFRACALVTLIASPFRLLDMSPFWSVVLGLTLYYSTTIAEVIRSSLRSLPKGQTEAGLAVGLTDAQTMTTVLLPQALKRATPNILVQTASLLKDTSLGFVVTFRDLLTQSQTAAKQFDNYFPMLLVCAGLYIVLIGSINFAATRLQRRSR